MELSLPLLDFFSAISQETRSSGSLEKLKKLISHLYQKKAKHCWKKITLNLIAIKYVELSQPLLDIFSAISQETRSSGS